MAALMIVGFLLVAAGSFIAGFALGVFIDNDIKSQPRRS